MASKELKATTVSIEEMPKPRRQHGVYYKLLLELKELAAAKTGKLVEFPSQKAGQRAIEKMIEAAAELGCVVHNTLHTDRVSRFIWVQTEATNDEHLGDDARGASDDGEGGLAGGDAGQEPSDILPTERSLGLRAGTEAPLAAVSHKARTVDRGRGMSTSDLKPCPFCGSAARWAVSTEADDYEVQCSNGDCAVLVMACGATERDAAARWNTRAK